MANATYICLISLTEKGKLRDAAAASSDRATTSRAVTDAGGTCELYSTRGSAYDYVSIMKGVPADKIADIAEQIEGSGNRRVTVLTGVGVRKG